LLCNVGQENALGAMAADAAFPLTPHMHPLIFLAQAQQHMLLCTWTRDCMQVFLSLTPVHFGGPHSLQM